MTTKIRRRPMPVHHCASGFLDSGPSEGCSEWSEPVWHPCRRPATHRAKFSAAQYLEPETVKVCEQHAHNLRRHGERVYRFRRL